jgi:uroporphyrinogen III methyltransferase / synthase
MLSSSTGARDAASELVSLVQVDWVAPLIVTPRFADMKQALAKLAEWRTIAFTSAHAVDALIGALRSLGHDVRALFGIRLVAVGGVTAARLNSYGLSADLVAEGGAIGLAQALIEAGDAFGEPILHPRALDGRTELGDALSAAGRRIEVVPAYETSIDEAAIAGALREHHRARYDAIGFFSPRGVDAFVAIFGAARLAGVALGAIGETTRSALAAHGLGPIVVAEHASAGALLAALSGALDVRG